MKNNLEENCEDEEYPKVRIEMIGTNLLDCNINLLYGEKGKYFSKEDSGIEMYFVF